MSVQQEHATSETATLTTTESGGVYQSLFDKINLTPVSAQLDALDERKGRYLTGSELKTAVYGIRQSLKEPPLEELLRQLEEQKQTGEVSPTLLTQIDTRLNQLLNRYVILLDTKVEQSQ
ncbi:VasL domain-containing protein [Escherichia coli]|uniref:VasL domain-containing protein n=1 Tax=Escherichia coli TaxID=562 RepID=UPI00202E9C1E|nr:VasL domain-containing protein [Escherichia coli]MDC9073162.1 VasL domain-containing protein [Escherichia coli]MDC9115752.1 VasL domain-containing protein [Escherichia coli]